MTTALKEPKIQELEVHKVDAVVAEQEYSALASLLALRSKLSLLRLMVQRDFIGRYKGSMLGALWPFLNPLGHMILYTFLFSIILKVRFTSTGNVGDFAMYLMAGYLPWTATGEALSMASKKILDEPNLVKRVVFPLELLPLMVAISSFLSCAIALGLLVGFILIMTHKLHITMILVPLVFLSQFLFTAGLCWLLSALGVFLRDIQHFIALALSAWMYATPIIYPAEMVPEFLKFTLWINPMAGIILDYRHLMLEGKWMDPWMYLCYTSISLVTFLGGYYLFHKMKRSFADVV
ncbi:MAG: ABC transporter permease [Candidatus Obscuribacterales bacterium]